MCSISPTPRFEDQHIGDATSPKNSQNYADSLAYLHSLTAGDLDSACFSESLVTFSGTGQEVGRFDVSISLGDEGLVVTASSDGVVDSIPCGTSIVALLSRSAEMLEQKHIEYVELDSHPMKRETVITFAGGQYSLKSTVQHDQESKSTKQIYSSEEMATVIPEGSNLLLQRLMVIKGLPVQGLELRALNTDLSICTVQYRSLEPKVIVVGEEQLSVVGIERSLNCEQPVIWRCYFTSDGHLVERTQVGSSISMRLTQVLSSTDDEDEQMRTRLLGKQKLNWETDLQLNSKFLDRKEELKANHYSYMRQHPDLQSIVADFLQHVLFHRPDDIVAAAKVYFSAFLPDTL